MGRDSRVWILIVIAALMCAVAPAAGAAAGGKRKPPPPPPPPPPAPSPTGTLHTSGNLLLDGSGARVHVTGVNVSGTEYACWQGWGIFDGPHDLAQAQIVRSWGANTVSVSLNESCWLSLNGVSAKYSGATYRDGIKAWVDLLTSQGLNVNLRLHWLTDRVPDMPDRAHANDFWRSVAITFASNPRVSFDLAGEPHPDGGRDSDAAWSCWLGGGTCPGLAYTAAGMQEMVDAVRSTGATNLIVLTGVAWGNGLTKWLANKPADPLNNLAAGVHVYTVNGCITTACWDTRFAPVAAQVPLIATEAGEGKTFADGAFLTSVMTWFDAHDAGYLVWTWNRWNNYAMDLVADWSGTPTIPYGATVKSWFLSRPWAT
jgi:hypothetical protein